MPVTLMRLPALATHAGLGHATSERTGGVSRAPFASLNLSLGVGDDPAAVLENRRQFAAAIGQPLSRFVLAEQVHGAHVAVVGAGDAGRGSTDQASRVPSSDALVTDDPSVVLLVLSADCVPVVLFDPVRRVAGAVHAGRRGTLAGVTEAAVRAMHETFGCNPKDVVAGIGPSIGPDDYTVRDDAVAEVRAALPYWREVLRERASGGTHVTTLDLWTANVRQLTDAGVLPSSIARADLSTYAHEDRFFSHRRQQQRDPRSRSGIFGTAVWLTNAR